MAGHPTRPAQYPPTAKKVIDDSLFQAEETRIPRYRGVSYTKPIDAAKEAVPVMT